MRKEKIDILIVNLNNIGFTKSLLGDLLRQTHPFSLTLIDNASEEIGTKEFFDDIRSKFDYKVIMFKGRVDLNRLWNSHYLNSREEYICFLNNDVRIPSNFVEDTVNIFEKEPSVGCVTHATNHPDYQKVMDLKYDIPEYKFVQGWDFTLRWGAFSMIPEDLKVFGGDDYIFNHFYNIGWKVGVALSSPIIHFKAKSRKYFNGNRKEETLNLRKLYPEKLMNGSLYTKERPTFSRIIER